MPPAMYPPTGPSPADRLRPVDARRAVEEAIAAARERDRQLRAEIARLARARVGVVEDVAAAHAEAADGRVLAGRALVQADEAARAGQRADAARRTDVARVFAMRWRDARERAEVGEREIAAIDESRRRAEAGLAANAGALDAAAAAHLASLSGRRAARLRAEVDATVAAVDSSAAELVIEAETEARAERAAGAGRVGPPAAEPVPLDELEDEVDLESVDPLLDELRSELGLAGARPVGDAVPAAPGSAAPGTEGAVAAGEPAGDEPPGPPAAPRGRAPARR